MPSNFDKMVRARMAKTGEGWQQAARHVRGQAAGVAGEAEKVTEDAEKVVQAVEDLRRLSAAGERIRGPLLTAVHRACDAVHSGLSVRTSVEVWRATGAFRAAYQEVIRKELDEVGALADAEAVQEPNVIEDGFEDLDDERRAWFRAAIRRLDAGALDRTNGTDHIVGSLRPASVALLRYLVGLANPGSPRPDVRVLDEQEADARHVSRFDRMRTARDARGDTAADDQELLRCALRIRDAILAWRGPDINDPVPLVDAVVRTRPL